MLRTPGVSRFVAAVFSVLGYVASGGCGISFSNDAEAHDQWKKNYSLTQPGSLEIRNTNGLVEVQPGDGNAVEVVADRSVKAASDDAAKDALAHFEIGETITPDHITLNAAANQTMLLGGSRKVDFHVRVPKWAGVTIDTSNGEIRVTGVAGPFRATATNGRIRGTDLEGAATVTTTNGVIALDFAKFGDADVSCETTNGEVTLSLPSDAKARLSARVTNGAISHSGLTLAVAEESRRALDASIGGGGGPMVRVSTTNGAIVIKARQ